MLHKPIQILKLSPIIITVLFLLNCVGEKSSENNSLPKIIIQTSMGNITVEIDQQKAPVTATNFLKYVDEKRFIGATFYRVVRMDNQPSNKIKIQVIQGGIEFAKSDLSLKPIKHETTKETGILHKNGTISMARNEPGTASSEFFICIGDQPELDFGGKRNPDGQGFAAFGHVIDGMAVVLQIQKQVDDNQMLISPIKIEDMRRLKMMKYDK
jgi:peptidyl-prolyl cis-trans isomerase A (cyclophilin A)